MKFKLNCRQATALVLQGEDRRLAWPQRWALLCEPSQVAAEPLVELLLLARDGSVQAFWRRSGLARLSLEDLLAEG